MNNKKIIAALALLIAIAVGYILWREFYSPAAKEADPFAVMQISSSLDDATRARLQKDIDVARKMYVEKPNIWETWIAIGGLKNTLGDYEGAIAAYKKSLAITSNNILGLRNIAEVYRMGLKDYNKAATYYRLAIANNFSDVELYIALSQVSQYQLKDNAAAEKALLDGMARLDNHPDILGALIRFYETTGNREKYEETVRKLRVAFPNNAAYRDGWPDVK